MEFEDHEEHEEEEEEEEEEEMGLPPSYDSLPNSSRVKMMAGSAAAEQSPTPVAAAAAAGGLVPSTGQLVPSAGTTTTATAMRPRYRECLKNHAVGMGGHAVDGCGEFMAAGAEGTLDALKCAACNCHRNFHRKEIATGAAAADPIPASIFHAGHGHNQVPQFAPYYRSPAGYLHVGPPQPRPPLALPSTSGGGQSREDQEDVLNSSGGGGGGGGDGSSRKRFRTKFTAEQKERMLDLAERLGWRIQKHDEAVVQQFCNETGVRRQVLKVWMHNNKHTLGKKP